DPAVVFWSGETLALPGGLTLIRCGGHFEGALVLHLPAGAGGRGGLLGGGIPNRGHDRGLGRFMCTYPNPIPPDAPPARPTARGVQPFAFDRIYSAWFDKTMDNDAKAAVGRSVERYLKAIEG